MYWIKIFAIAFLLKGNSVLANDKDCGIRKTYYTLAEALAHKDCVKDFSYRVRKKENLSTRIGELSGLEMLDLKSNSFSYLPQEIGKLKRLKHLTLTENHLRKLPEAIGELNALTFLQA